MEEERFTGTVKWFSDGKGFGFIEREEGNDVFVHHTGIRAGGPRSLNDGDKVEFSIEKNPRGDKAIDLVVTEAAPPSSDRRW